MPDGCRYCPTCGTQIKEIVALITGTSSHQDQTPKVMIPSMTSLRKKLEYYRDRVLYIDTRNHSILLRSIKDESSFDLVGCGSAKKIIEYALIDRKSVCIVPDSDRSDSADKDRTRLTNLSRNVTDIYRETGRHEIYLGFPFLVGHISKDVYVRGPLILFPVSIIYRSHAKPAGWYVSFSEDKDPMLNRALLEILRKKNIGLPDSFKDEFESLLSELEESREEEKQTIESLFLKRLLTILRENKLPLDYNFRLDKLEPFNRIHVDNGRVSIDDQRSWIDNEGLHLQNYKIIGIFPQGESAIYSDYEELIKRSFYSEDFGIIKKLLPEDMDYEVEPLTEDYEMKQTEAIKLDSIPPDKINLVIASDASQDTVVLASQSSECIVVRGPPGTGKSQVIVNLISNALSKGHRVLLICDNRQALEVVYNRLDTVGLSRYIAPLYDAKDQSTLYKKFSSILESSVPFNDIEQINQKFNYYSHEIWDTIGRQNKIIDALKDETTVGVSVCKLYAVSPTEYAPKLDLSNIVSDLKYHALPRLLDTIKGMEEGCKKFDSPAYPWYFRNDFSNLSFTEKHNIVKIIDRLLDLSKSTDMIFIWNSSDQRTLINSLETLMSTKQEKGLFRKFLGSGKERMARDSIGRLLHQSLISNEIEHIEDLNRRAKIGMEIWNVINELSLYVKEERIIELSKTLAEGSFNSKLIAMREALDNFDEIQAHDKRKGELSPKEKEALNLCVSELFTETNWSDILEQEFHLHWIDVIERKYPDLRGQPFETYLHNRDKLSTLLKEHRKVVVQRIMNQINSSIMRPEMKLNRNLKAQYSKWNTLLDELHKKRHVLPIRKLVERYESIILKVAPCWLATPSAVSSIFPLKRTLFDYIIFDEASQCSVEKTLPALERGQNFIIVGDEKQLPPIKHFSIGGDDLDIDEDKDRTLFSSSLLSLANRVFDHTYLKWHYRSVHPELIDFSNSAFYDKQLKIAPSISRNATPIMWIPCSDGSWIGRKNKPEAKLVVDQLKNILLKNKQEGLHLSVGIVTFNKPQKKEINDEIDRRRQLDPEFEELYSLANNEDNNKLEDLLLIRNIERVQGEERDIIIFSTGYARDLANPEEKISVQFGSLNRRDGEKYLNVAITRARREIIVVCSFDPYRIKVDDTQHNGPKKLRDYLCYAKSISDSKRQETINILQSLHSEQSSSTHSSEPEGHLAQSIRNELQKLGYEVDLDVGHSNYKIDIAVVHPDLRSKYILAIELDGKAFLSAESTKERDIVRQEFLENNGWPVERIWSRNWWRDSKKEINRINKRLQALRAIPKEGNMNTTSKPTSSIETQVDLPSEKIENKIMDLIKKGESEDTEFKSSLIWDYKIDQPSKILWHPVLKTVIGFMNSDGGLLIVGIADDGEILGLDKDFQVLRKKQGWDEWIQHFINVFNEYIGKELISFVKVKSVIVAGKTLALIEVKRNDLGPTYLDSKGKSEFYIRSGTTTQLLNTKETVNYIKQHRYLFS